MSHAERIMAVYNISSHESRKGLADALGYYLNNLIAETTLYYDSSNPSDMPHYFAAKVAGFI